MNTYLLQLDERFGEGGAFTQHLIRAEDRQQVKYLFHKHLRDIGYTNPMWANDKHTLELWDINHVIELSQIKELSYLEWDVLSEHLPKWTEQG